MEVQEQKPMTNQTPKTPKWSWIWWIFIALTCALLLSNLAGDTIKNIFFSLLSGLTPIIVGCILAFLLLEPIKWIENKLLKNAFVGNPKAKKYKRIISLTSCYLIVIGIITAIIAFLVPYIIEQLQVIINNRDEYIEKIKEELVKLITSITSLSSGEVGNSVSNLLDGFIDWLGSVFMTLQNDIANIVSIVTSIIAATFLGVLISILLLKDKELIASTGRRYTYAFNTRKKADEILATVRRSSSMFNQWLISNIIVMAIIFIIAWIGYEIIGVPMAFFMALLLGLLSFIPYVGGFIALIPVGLLSIVFSSVTTALIAIVFGVVVWAAVTTFIPPILFSKRLQTRSLVIILSMIIFGAAFGVWGMILAAPVASTISIIMQERVEVKEAQREREELIEAGVIDPNAPAGISEMLDLAEDRQMSSFVEEASEENTSGLARKMIRAANVKAKAVKQKNEKAIEQLELSAEQSLKEKDDDTLKDDNKEKETKKDKSDETDKQ